jgi:hypothetical protein
MSPEEQLPEKRKTSIKSRLLAFADLNCRKTTLAIRLERNMTSLFLLKISDELGPGSSGIQLPLQPWKKNLFSKNFATAGRDPYY